MSKAIQVDFSNIIQIQKAILQIGLTAPIGIPSGASQLHELPTASTLLSAGTPFYVVGLPMLFEDIEHPDVSDVSWDFPCTLMWSHTPESRTPEVHWFDLLQAQRIMLNIFKTYLDLEYTATIASISGTTITVPTGEEIPPTGHQTLIFHGSAQGDQPITMNEPTGITTFETASAPFTDHTSVTWATCFKSEIPGGANGLHRLYRNFDDNRDLPWLCLDWTVRAHEYLQNIYTSIS